MLNERLILAEKAFVEMVVWLLSSPVAGCRHEFKYRLAFIVEGKCVLRYDNESGKGDHKHIGKEVFPISFSTPETLLKDFWNDVKKWGL